jgi:hypothetical protein
MFPNIDRQDQRHSSRRMRVWLGALPLSLMCASCGGKASLGTSEGAAGGETPPPGQAYRISVSVPDKIDLLFMIDNSISMADKQEVFQASVPELVNRFIDPICVDRDTGLPTGDSSSSDGCDTGEPEFRAVEDIHIGVVTSSLGGHGGILCSPEHQSASESYYNETQNDRGHLIVRARDPDTSVQSYNGVGFLSWDPGGTAKNPPPNTPGTADRAALITDFQNLVTGAGEQGCGFEASLEAWYRFLVDPMPPADVVRQLDASLGQEVSVPVVDDPLPAGVDGGRSAESLGQEASVPVGADEVLLEQRKQFLRPDSLVLIVMLSDEDDCSVMDKGIGWYVGNVREGVMPRSTSACDNNPNDPCCLSCIQASWPEQCGDPRDDLKCYPPLHETADDRLNLRCFNQKQRLGMDFLYPTERYVNALTSHELQAYDGSMHPNPLFDWNEYYPQLVPRLDSSRIFLAGIVGVPWQDIATDETVNDPNALDFMTAAEINQRGFWDLILGNPDASPPVAPADPFMIQSVAPRSGANPRTGVPIAPPTEGAGGPALNGHEYDIQGNNDLQYACIFQLGTAKECANVDPGVGCDCKVSTDIFMRPLCNGTTQTHAKAYPGLRFLEVLKDYGANSILASICPKNPVGEGTDPNYGHNPAARAIVNAVRPALKGHCLEQALPVDPSGKLRCPVVEVSSRINPAPCDGLPGRKALAPELAELTRAYLDYWRFCGEGGSSCDDFSLCELTPAPDAEVQSCLNDDDAALTATGYCYIDAMTDRDGNGVLECSVQDPGNRLDCLGNPELVAECPATERRRLRFASPAGAAVPLPWPNSFVVVVCPEGVTGP